MGCVKRWTLIFENFYSGVGGLKWRYLDPVFGKLDLRVRNSVYRQRSRRPFLGVMGVGWGQDNAKIGTFVSHIHPS
jgi:hypothetical protein